MKKLAKLIKFNTEIYSTKEGRLPCLYDKNILQAEFELSHLICHYLTTKYDSIAFWIEDRDNTSSLESDLSKDYIAIIDPIDGTDNYRAGLPNWGISVSLFKRKLEFKYGFQKLSDYEHFESALVFPKLDLSLTTFRRNLLAYQTSLPLRTISENIDVSDIPSSERQHIKLSCCTLSIYNVIRNKYLSYQSNAAHAWDIAAGINLALKFDIPVWVDVATDSSTTRDLSWINDSARYTGQLLSPIHLYRVFVGNNDLNEIIYMTNIGYLLETRLAIDCWIWQKSAYKLAASFTRSNDGLLAAKRFLDKETDILPGRNNGSNNS